MKGLVLSGIAMVTVACGASSPVAPSPSNAVRAPTGFGVISGEGSATPLGVNLAECLRSSPVPGCFSSFRARVTTRAVAPLSVPDPPSALTATVAGNSVTLTWSGPASGDAPAAYVIEAGSSPGLANLASLSTGNPSRIYQASGIAAGTYFVRVRATNGSGVSAPSNEAVVVVQDGCSGPPAPPGGLALASASGTTVSLRWNASAGAVTSYIVEVGSGPQMTNLVNRDLGSSTSLTATDIAFGTYYVRVRARNACDISTPSNEISVVVAPSPPVPASSVPAISNITANFTTNTCVRAADGHTAEALVIAFDYVDGGGDLAGGRVRLDRLYNTGRSESHTSLVPAEVTMSGTPTAGRLTISNACPLYDNGTSSTETLTLFDADGRASNSLSITVSRPAGDP